MRTENKKKKESLLANKTIEFAVSIIKFYQYLCNEKKLSNEK